MGPSPAAETARAYVERAADSHDAVLISAEPGLDAIAVCRAIHDGSDLTAYPLVVVNCADQRAELLDRELATRTGRRTLALTNLEQLPFPLQHRLGQVLDADFVRFPKGDARVIATVTGNAEDAILEGTLLRELCMRFPLHLEVPPLRRRAGDVPILVGCVAAEAAAAGGVGVPVFSRDALTLLAALPWHRNFEELREVLDVLVRAAAGGAVRLDDVLGHVPIERLRTRPVGTSSLREARSHFEREYIAFVLSRHSGRMDEAARTLGMQRTNLYRKVRQLGIGRTRSK